MIRRDEVEKSEIIHMVEHSTLPVKKALDELQVPRSTFYRWYKQYQEDGTEGLIDHRPNPGQIWNRIPKEVKQQVVELALEHPDRSPRQIAWLFTDEKGYFISESSTYRMSIAAPSVPVIAALICTTKRSVEGVRVLNLLGRQDLN
jgi:transposase